MIEKSAGSDTLVISAPTAGRVYDGDAWSSSSRPVAGTAANSEACDVVVTAVDDYIYTDVGWLGPLVQAEQSQHTNAAGLGDSGGPVVSLTGPDWNLLMADGTITAGDPNTVIACTGVQGRTCYWRIWYADVNLALAQHNASILTS